MNLDELQRVQSKERRTDSLQNLRPSFYQEVGTYIADRKRERERVADRADDPFSSPEVNRLTDEIETATDVVEAIYERRMGKLVKQASLAAAGMSADDEGLTGEEADLFDDLVERIRTNKGQVLDVLEGAGGESASRDSASSDGESTAAGAGSPPEKAANRSEASGPETRPDGPQKADSAGPSESDPTGTTDAGEPPTAPSDGDPSDGAGTVSAADAMGGGPPTPEGAGRTSESGESASEAVTDPDDENEGSTESRPNGERSDGGDRGRSAPDAEPTAANEETDADEAVDRVTVRITRDVGSILGIDDREYTLRADDVVALPEQNATPLVEREAAEPLE